MSKKLQQSIEHACRQDRRHFLLGTGSVLAALATGLLGPQARAVHAAETGPAGVQPGPGSPAPARAIFQDMPYFDFTGKGAVYMRPSTATGRTRDYVQSLSQEEFLRRHYFS